MFTGIVEALGDVVDVTRYPDAARLSIRGAVIDDLQLGDSVSVNGACLTVATLTGDGFTADVMQETLNCTSLGGLAVGDPVNLERAVTPTTRLGGHIVQGHVDAVGLIVDRRHSEHWDDLDLELPDDLSAYVVEKGSITVDGVSLTVAALAGAVITVSLIPETLRRTTLGFRAVGDRINVEVDVLAKYVERRLAGYAERLLAARAVHP